MKAVIIVAMSFACHLVAAQEKVCTSFCSNLGMLRSSPGKSCDDIYQINKVSRGVSSNYFINTTTGVHQVYCDMELECGGHKGGWMRLADLDATRGDDCPSGWINITTPVEACISASSDGGCHSANFSTFNMPYSRVCGMIVGYQKGSTDGFAAFGFPIRSINGPYVDGISITYGNPRKHIWTYGIGHTDSDSVNGEQYNCPCSHIPGPLPPIFVHDNYYCESGRLVTPDEAVSDVFINDPVWDGKGCSSDNGCCSEPSLPWFYRQFPLATNEDIETRICHDAASHLEDVLVRELQLYVM